MSSLSMPEGVQAAYKQMAQSKIIGLLMHNYKILQLLHPKSCLYTGLEAEQDTVALLKRELLYTTAWLLKLRLKIQKVCILLHLLARIGFHYLK